MRSPDALTCARDDCVDFYRGDRPYCEWENSYIYYSKFYFRGDRVRTPPSWKFNQSVTYVSEIYLLEEDIEDLENLEIPLTLIYENSPFLEGTEIVFEIYKINRGADFGFSWVVTKDLVEETLNQSNLGYERIASVVSSIENGNAEASWTFSGRNLLDWGYDGEVTISFYIFIPESEKVIFPGGSNSMNAYGTIGSVQSNHGQLSFVTKTGECRGSIPCESLQRFDCLESRGYTCEWSEETNSCAGTEDIPCNIITQEDFCTEAESLGCRWYYYSFWSNFKAWFSRFFAGG